MDEVRRNLVSGEKTASAAAEIWTEDIGSRAGRSGLIFGSEKILAKVTGSPGNSVLKKRFQQGLNFPLPRGHDPNGRTQSECWRWGDAVP